ncbi:MAG: hypothetical protein FJ253_00120 [Phycisphaerae bacterium]|nr:hypothetical protein [Phycisphaerae bacterium]
MPAMTSIVERLERLRRRARLVLLSERSAVLLAVAIGAAMGWVALDALLRFPATLRFVALVVGVIAIASAIARWWWPAARFRPSLPTLALRVERQRPDLAGRLASGVEFAQRPAPGVLEKRVVESTERLAGDDPFTGVIRRDRLRRALVGCGAALVAVAAIAAFQPEFAAIGAKRLFAPWSSAEWPARTLVQSLMEGVTHLPRGRAVLLRAEAVRGDPASMRPFVRYRTTRQGVAGPWRDAALARQHGEVFERPLEVDADSIEFRFGTSDAMTDAATIHFVRPPAIERATLRAEPPAYASAVQAPSETELGPGTDARATLAAPLLAGSRVELDFAFNRELPVPRPDDDSRREWLRRTFGGDLPESTQVEAPNALSDRVTLRFEASDDLDLPIELRDEHGIVGDDGARYRLAVSPDRPPAASITDPAADEIVLPSAALAVTAEARDDLSIDEIGVRVEKVGGEVRDTMERRRGESARLSTTVTPEQFGAGPGDTLLVSAIATDDFEQDGVRREPTISPPRRIRVVSEEEFTRQIRTQLAAIRHSAIRAEATQREIIASTAPSEPAEPGEQTDPNAAADGDGANADPDRANADATAPKPSAEELARRQARVSDRIQGMSAAIESLQSRARAGGLERDAMNEILRQSQDLLENAASRSAQASTQLAERGTTPEAAESQEAVRAELEDLVRLLDRDEDAWVATRRIERLREQIEGLLEETRRTGERTVGRDLERLSAEERVAIDRLASRDRSVADEARETMEELRDRAARLAEADRARAAGMQEAARRGEERQIARRVEQAAEATALNQPTNAEQALREAAETAQSMMDAIRDDRRSRVEELRRRLAGLEQSIQGLVTQAQTALSALREAAPTASAASDLAPVSEGVVSLDRNIGAVTDEARSGGGTERVARVLERAGERSAASAGLLRADPPRVPEGDEALDRSRGLLVDALEAVREQRRNTEQQQADAKRRELAAALRTLSERQAGLRTASEPLEGAKSADRRRLVEGRRLSVEQSLIRTAVNNLKSENEELASSDLFVSALARLDGWMVRSESSLSSLSVTKWTLEEQSLSAETLAMMGQALADASASDDPFAEAAGAAAGGAEAGGEGAQAGRRPPAIPPVAELKLLRESQAQLARRTRMADEGGLTAAERQTRLRELTQLQQELLDQGEAWMERMRQMSPGGTAEGADAK